MLGPLDEFPVHQVPQPIAWPGRAPCVADPRRCGCGEICSYPACRSRLVSSFELCPQQPQAAVL